MTDQTPWPVLIEYGETEPGRDGVSVRLSLVQTPRGSHRVRLQLRRDGLAIKHIDIGGPTAQKLADLLVRATTAGKDDPCSSST
jgi:hypothetical protein